MQIERVNEVGRAAILLPPEATFYSGSHYLAVAFDSAGGGEPAAVVLGGSPLPFEPLWALMSLLCGDRAQRAVDQTLLVQGRAITPEAYLKLWRDACLSPLSPEAFAARSGVVPTFVIEGSLSLARGCRSAWESSPFATFDDFEEAYREEMDVSEDGVRFVLALDARRLHAARDAFYAASFLTRYDRPQGQREVGSARTELRPVGAAPVGAAHSLADPAPEQSDQSDLFAFVEA